MTTVNEHFFLDSRGVKAEGIVTDGGFLLLKGSSIRLEHTPALAKSLVKKRELLIEKGIIENGILQDNVLFNSTSSAAKFVIGGCASGPQIWKDVNGMSMLEHEKLVNGEFKDILDREYLGFYKTVGLNEGSKCSYPTRLDTYGCGCAHDCSYCYARDMIMRQSGSWDPDHPRIADLKRIENKLKQIEKGTILRLGGITDCFQPIELIRRNTLKTIELLNKYGIGYLIVTKSHHVADDEYINIYDKKLAHIQITVTTFDDSFCSLFEHASPPSKRVEAIEKLQKLGFDVSFRLSPCIDNWIDYEKLNNVKCDKILVEFLRVNPFILKHFDIDSSEYSVPERRYYHLPLERKKEILDKITGFKEITVCEDCTEHYNYFKQNYNPNPDDCCNLRHIGE